MWKCRVRDGGGRVGRTHHVVYVVFYQLLAALAGYCFPGPLVIYLHALSHVVPITHGEVSSQQTQRLRSAARHSQPAQQLFCIRRIVSEKKKTHDKFH